MNYRQLIRRPFDIVAWRPYIWLLGLLAGGATTFNYSGGGSSYRNSITYTGPSNDTLQTFWNNNWEWLVGIAAVAVVIFVVFFILGSIATGVVLPHAETRPMTAATRTNLFMLPGRRFRR